MLLSVPLTIIVKIALEQTTGGQSIAVLLSDLNKDKMQYIHKIIQDASRRQGRNPGSIDNDVTGVSERSQQRGSLR